MGRIWREAFLESERLGPGYLVAAEQYFDPLAHRIADAARAGSGSLLVALNGSQGSGKSTLCAYLRSALEAEHACSCIELSLDDFYLTRAEREALAANVHPLLLTRGVPGTHDVELLEKTLDALVNPEAGTVMVPRFSKANDDREPPEAWSRKAAPVDVVLLEGWCVGARSQSPAALRDPINELERLEDTEARWRSYADECLRKFYEPLYSRFDYWIMLAAPGFDQVLRWRTEQEDKLRQARGGKGCGLMDDAQLRRFVAHFERHTRQCLADLPPRCDVVLYLDADRNVVSATGLEN